VLLLLVLAACDSGPGDSDTESGAVGCFDQAPTVTIGGSGVDAEGRPTWTPMDEGSEQVMVHGPQGGWHLLASADVHAMEQIVTLVYTVEWPARGDVELSRGSFRVMLVADESGCGGVYAGMLGVLDVSELVDGEANTPPELLAGETLRIRITATDGEGREAADTRSVIAALDPADLPDTGG
jgi:hypothetical protein